MTRTTAIARAAYTALTARRVPRPARVRNPQGVISQYLALTVLNHRFYSLSHNLIHIVAASWMTSFLADHVIVWLRPSRLPALRVARLVHDPAIMVCLGVLMIGHQHDTTPIGEFFHDCWGAAFLAMGLLHFFSSMIHATHARHARLSMLARALHAYAFGPGDRPLHDPPSEPADPIQVTGPPRLHHAAYTPLSQGRVLACAGTSGCSMGCGRA